MKFSVSDYSAGCASTFLTLQYGLLFSAAFLAVYFVLKFLINRPSKRGLVVQLAKEMAERQRERRG